MKNYILRIYRQKRNNPRGIVGVVEEPEKKDKKAFTNLDELGEILNLGTKSKHGTMKKIISESEKKESIRHRR